MEQDQAHAALGFDGDAAVAWAEYGPVEELPIIHHRKRWEAETERRPDYRITCLFVDRKTSASFLYNATRTMYERLGFHYERPKGQGNCVMSTVVPAA